MWREPPGTKQHVRNLAGRNRRIDRVEEDDARLGALIRIRRLSIARGGSAEDARDHDAPDRRERSPRGAFDRDPLGGEAVPRPIAIELEHERDDPVVAQFGKRREGERRCRRVEGVAQVLRRREDDALAGARRKRQPVGREAQRLREIADGIG